MEEGEVTLYFIYCNIIYCLARERLQYTGNIRFPISGLSYSVTELWMSGNTDWWMMMQRKFIQMKAYWLVDVSGSYCSLKISIAVTYSSVENIIIYIWHMTIISGSNILRLQYIGNILQYMQYILHIAPWSEYCNIYGVSEANIATLSYFLFRGYNILLYGILYY